MRQTEIMGKVIPKCKVIKVQAEKEVKHKAGKGEVGGHRKAKIQELDDGEGESAKEKKQKQDPVPSPDCGLKHCVRKIHRTIVNVSKGENKGKTKEGEDEDEEF